MSGWRFAGYGSGSNDGKSCARPVQMVNVETGEHYSGRCEATRRSRCEFCAELHRGDVARIGRSGWVDRPTDRGYLLTLTAPGADVLGWDREFCGHSEGECSGKLGCRVSPVDAAAWHADVAQRWSWFMTEVRRLLPDGCRVEFLKTWELQARGVLHAHSMMRVEGPVSDRRVRAVFRLARQRWGFGPQMRCDQVDLSDPASTARAAGYVAKYVTKGSDDLPTVARLDRCTGEMRPGGLRAWSASRRWGDTMAGVRQCRREFAQLRAQLQAADGAGAGATATGDAGGGALDLNQDRYAGGAAVQAGELVSGLL